MPSVILGLQLRLLPAEFQIRAVSPSAVIYNTKATYVLLIKTPYLHFIGVTELL